MNKSKLFFFLFFISVFAHSQEIPIGEWRDHLSYRSAISVTEGNGKVYCATSGALFSYNKQDNSIEKMSRVTGLSDIRINTINFNAYNNTLVVGYENGNIDLIKDNIISNVSDIKREIDLGNKIINNIFFIDQYAYLACGFGIVVIDIEKKEVKDTYKIGTNGSNMNVYDISADGTNLFAATEDGLYTALLSSPNLNYYGSWSKIMEVPTGIYNNVEFFNNNIYAAFVTPGDGTKSDTIYSYNGSVWSVFLWDNVITKIKAVNNCLVLITEYSVKALDINLNFLKQINLTGFTYGSFKDAFIDQGHIVWIANSESGLVKAIADNNKESIYPNGPYSNDVANITSDKEKIWVARGSVNASWGDEYSQGEAYYYTSETGWNTVRGYQSAVGMDLDTAHDILTTAIDPKNNNRVFVSSFTKGIMEVSNGAVVKLHNANNSTLSPTFVGGRDVRAPGIGFDEDGKLWVNNSNTASCLSVLKPNNTWQAFNFSAYGMGSSSIVGRMMVTRSGQKWMMLPANGILVYQDNGTLAAPDDSNTRKITTEAGKGGLPSIDVYAIAEDLKDEIWVGTNQGVAVFYTQDAIFNGGNWDAQQILIEQDGNVQKLLETQAITTIAVDGANRKWIGTQNGGVFLISEDGQKEIFHFTTENSPLLSNEITSIAINSITGEVFFGTLNGIVSYRGTATEGLDEYKNVYTFPNPVRENYDGPIAIRGLVQNADVKITDITGTLVYKTKAQGGQAIWYGKNFQGEKVHTGVYLVFCSNEDGSKTFITKILFIN